jgi:glycosyltransferase involved in cell wall biosynthesis
MDELAQRGISQTKLWSRGIDRELFHPGHDPLEELAHLPRPLLLYVGRVAPEKNISAFLGAAVAGTKIIVGDGPALADLRTQFPDAHFLGALHGERLARAYCSADVFVFPSLTDTFGLVLIEALACGVPVAAFPVQGPIDILGPSSRGIYTQLDSASGALDVSLSTAIVRALGASRKAAAELGASFDWENCSDQFIDALKDSIALATATPAELETI